MKWKGCGDWTIRFLIGDPFWDTTEVHEKVVPCLTLISRNVKCSSFMTTGGKKATIKIIILYGIPMRTLVGFGILLQQLVFLIVEGFPIMIKVSRMWLYNTHLRTNLIFALIKFVEVISMEVPKPLQSGWGFTCKENTLCSWCHHCNHVKFKSDWADSLSFLPCLFSEQPPPPPVGYKTRAVGCWD